MAHAAAGIPEKKQEDVVAECNTTQTQNKATVKNPTSEPYSGPGHPPTTQLRLHSVDATVTAPVDEVQKPEIAVKGVFGAIWSSCFEPIMSKVGAPSTSMNMGEVGPLELVQMTNHQLGQGSEGVVRLGYMLKQQTDEKPKPVAVKELKSLKKEKLPYLLKLRHENLCALMGWAPDASGAGRAYLVMEYCANGSLYKLLAERRKTEAKEWIANGRIDMDAEWTLRATTDIAEGIKFLHDHDLMHRDLKSDNILLTSDWRCQVSDYAGCCRKTQTTEDSSDICASGVVGTKRWLAPEVIREGRGGPFSDIWSLGVIVWEILFGLKPYGKMEDYAVFFGVGNRSLSLPWCNDIPLVFDMVMKGTLQYDRKRRFNSTLVVETLKQARRDIKDTWQSKPAEDWHNKRSEWQKALTDYFVSTHQCHNPPRLLAFANAIPISSDSNNHVGAPRCGIPAHRRTDAIQKDLRQKIATLKAAQSRAEARDRKLVAMAVELTKAAPSNTSTATLAGQLVNELRKTDCAPNTQSTAENEASKFVTKLRRKFSSPPQALRPKYSQSHKEAREATLGAEDQSTPRLSCPPSGGGQVFWIDASPIDRVSPPDFSASLPTPNANSKGQTSPQFPSSSTPPPSPKTPSKFTSQDSRRDSGLESVPVTPQPDMDV